jgi:hypothetical protein
VTTPIGQRSTAVREAGRGVMAYVLGRPFTEISVTGDDDSYGRIRDGAAGDWFRPDIETNGRTRNMIEDRVMIALAGAETEAAWYARLPVPPDGWQEHVDDGAQADMRSAIWYADFMCGGVPEVEAYLQCLARPLAEGEEDFRRFPEVVSRVTEGEPRFWALVTALADAVQAAGTLTWRQARRVLREADPFAATGRGSV